VLSCGLVSELEGDRTVEALNDAPLAFDVLDDLARRRDRKFAHPTRLGVWPEYVARSALDQGRW
jgi:hypothetical protein